MNMICLKRMPMLKPSAMHWPFKSDIWALDTPQGRHSLSKLAELGNASFGPGTHWIQDEVVGASVSATPLERRSSESTCSNPDAEVHEST